MQLALQTATITQVGMLNERVNRVLQVAPLVRFISIPCLFEQFMLIDYLQ